jgi:hypothetical protein
MESFLTGFEVEQKKNVTYKNIEFALYPEPYNIGEWACCYDLNADGFKLGARAYITGEDSINHIESKRIDEKETEQLIALAVSKVWEAKSNHNKIPFFGYQSIADAFNNPKSAYYKLRDEYQPVVLELLYQEMRKLTLEEKALHTLANLCLVENNIGEGAVLNVALGYFPGVIFPIEKAKAGYTQNKIVPTQGICHGCVDNEALIVLHYLIGEKYISLDENVTPVKSSIRKIYITPEGYIQANRIRSGKNKETGHGFLICRFVPEIIGPEGVQKNIYEPISRKFQCEIHTVADIPHNDRIDDRIMKEIQEASVIVVDLTEHNFNVAFEAGYALALGKPIIWTMKKTEDKPDLPFDIQSHNILFYSKDDHEEFKKIFEARMQTAMKSAFGSEGRQGIP